MKILGITVDKTKIDFKKTFELESIIRDLDAVGYYDLPRDVRESYIVGTDIDEKFERYFEKKYPNLKSILEKHGIIISELNGQDSTNSKEKYIDYFKIGSLLPQNIQIEFVEYALELVHIFEKEILPKSNWEIEHNDIHILLTQPDNMRYGNGNEYILELFII